MELTDAEKKMVAYARAYKENRSGSRIIKVMVPVFALALVTMVLNMTEVISQGYSILIVFILIGVVIFIASRIRRPEKAIAERILKEM